MVIPDKKLFLAATIQIIKRFEGGYFHPFMYVANKNNPGWQIMSTSGETLFGLDRHAGHGNWYKSKRKSKNVLENLKFIPTYQYKNQESEKFWETLDSLQASTKWKYGFRGGDQEDKLTLLAANSMYPVFVGLMDRYFTDQAKLMIYKDPRLLFHFIYAAWNGEGFFKFYAQNFLKKLKTTSDTDQILKQQIQLRKDSNFKQIAKSGNILDNLFKSKEWESVKKGFEIFEEGLKDSSGLITIFIAAILFLFLKK